MLVAIFCLPASALAAEVQGVKFPDPDKMKANAQDLTFNGGSKSGRCLEDIKPEEVLAIIGPLLDVKN